MYRQPGHLNQITHGGFGHIGLPVGVGDEADGRVEGQVRAGSREALGIERQQVLEAQDQVQRDEAGDAEGQHGHGVAEPVLALVGFHAEGLVEHALDRAQHRVEPGALALPDARQIEAQRKRQGHRHCDGEQDFRPAPHIHGEDSFSLSCATAWRLLERVHGAVAWRPLERGGLRAGASEFLGKHQGGDHIDGHGCGAGPVEQDHQHGQARFSRRA